MFLHTPRIGALGLLAGIALVPAVGSAGTVTTMDGNGADMFIGLMDGLSIGTYQFNYGKTPWMGASNGYDYNYYARKAYMRFDTETIGGDIAGAMSATLSLTVASQPATTIAVTADTRVYRVYGLNNGAPGDGAPVFGEPFSATVGWSEGTEDDYYAWGWEPMFAANAPAHTESYVPYLESVTSDATLLGTFSITGAPDVNSVVSFSSAGLLDFLKADTNHLVTLILAEETAENQFGGEYYKRIIPFATRETAAGVGAPSLTVAVPEPATMGLLALGSLGLLARRRHR